MKKIICLILAVIMLIPMLPTMAAGDTSKGASNAYFKVGNGYYSTLQGAINDAASASDKTVYLLKDITTAEHSVTVPSGADIILDLGGHTIKTTDKTDYYISKISRKLNVKNGSLNVALGLVVQDGGHLILDNVNLTVSHTGAEARPAVKLSYEGNTELTVKNSYLKTVGPGESLILAEFATDATVNLEGNTVLEYAGVLDESPQNCAPVAVQQGWGKGYDSSSPTSNTDLVLNVGANAKIVNTAPKIDNPEYTAAAIVLQTSGNVKINLDAGATIAIDRESGTSVSTHINRVTYTGNVEINDKGANWLVSQKALKSGGITFSTVWSSDSRIIAWTDGVNYMKPGTAYASVSATKDMSFSPVSIGDGDITLLDGASIRSVADEPALRFTTVISQELYAFSGKKIKFGTIISKGTTNPGRTSNEKYDTIATKFVRDENGDYVYHAAIYLDNNGDGTIYRDSYAAISYVSVRYYDKTQEIFYTDFDKENVRSVKKVAANLDMSGITHTLIDYILSVAPGADDMLTSILAGYCTEDSLYTGKFDGSYWHAAGMGYVIKTVDGKLIAIDGGNTVDAYGFYYLLREYYGSEKVVVDYWILTHPHGDHVNALLAIAANSTLSKNLEIKNLVFHFPTDFDSSTASFNKKMQNIAAKYGANVINPTKGQVIEVGAAKITFLYVIEDYEGLSTANKLSLIFTVETEKKIMFTGDIYNEGLEAVYSEYGDALKCDILQMPHHFLCDTGYQPFYEAADASAVLLPTCIAGYDAMYTLYANNTKHLANDWAAKNADDIYVAFDGNFEIAI